MCIRDGYERISSCMHLLLAIIVQSVGTTWTKAAVSRKSNEVMSGGSRTTKQQLRRTTKIVVFKWGRNTSLVLQMLKAEGEK